MFYQYHDFNRGGGCSAITDHIPYNHGGWNRAASSFFIPAGKSISLFTGSNYTGKCLFNRVSTSDSYINLNGSESSHNDKVESIRINESCVKHENKGCWGNDKCGKNSSGGNCDWCGVGHKCCRQRRGGGSNPCSYWDGGTSSHQCVKSWK